MESSGSPALTLVVENGPRKGEIVECLPGSRVRIGRIVRGNTFTIKDPSISQSHVSIECAGGGGGWTVADLDSSNGTFLNGVQIQPFVPAELRGGDAIKIGEHTTIHVKIGEAQRRSPKRGGGAAGTSDAPLEKPAGRGRGRPRRACVAARVPDAPSLEPVDPDGDGGKSNVRGGRRKAGASASRRGRPPRNPATRVLNPVPEEPEVEEAKDSSPVERIKASRAGGRSGTASLAGVKVEPAAEMAGGNPSVDMERMTLEEWFHRMENHLPKVIHGVAEQVIADIRAKAEMFKDYVEHSSSTQHRIPAEG
ncbi:unnamed protein product [Spirodela intermedia]|uniref:FHA domain-containing protein n=1 Tax=Spirodela intermedia TaxID=51605 RepID=A0A7I8LHT1_SPIIN|nr:unnamed protein product [Spirodela intermedia]